VLGRRWPTSSVPPRAPPTDAWRLFDAPCADSTHSVRSFASRYASSQA
jgi:hypothetical protein